MKLLIEAEQSESEWLKKKLQKLIITKTKIPNWDRNSVEYCKYQE